MRGPCSSGADLKERASGTQDAQATGNPMANAMERLASMAAVTIAAVNGPVRAGGVGLMAACNLIVVNTAVTFRVHRGPHRRGTGDHQRADPGPLRLEQVGRPVPHRKTFDTTAAAPTWA